MITRNSWVSYDVINFTGAVSKYEFNPSKYEFKLSKYEFKLSKYEFKLLKYEFKLSKYEFKLSKYEFKLSKYEFKLSILGVNSKSRHRHGTGGSELNVHCMCWPRVW